MYEKSLYPKKCISKYKQLAAKVIVSESFLNEVTLLIWFKTIHKLTF